jgi:tungstate transport system ATP-binding protein
MALYELDHVTHDYTGKTVLTIDHLELAAGSVTGVMGPNGSGKSTLLTLLGCIMMPSRGRIRFNGRTARPFSDAIRGKVSLLPQESFLLKRSVFRNVAYGLKALNGGKELQQRALEALLMVGLDWEAYSRRPWYALSGGEARRVALAARLALHPEVLIMDEPTTSVDATSAQMIKDAALHARKQWGTTLIISSHDTEWLEDICTHTLHLFRGRPMGGSRRNLIFGPWEIAGDKASRALGDDQHFLAASPPKALETAVAAIEARHLDLHPPSAPLPQEHHRLSGLLLRLSYEQSTHRKCASVLVGNTTLAIYLSDDPFCQTCQPGQPVEVVYSPSSVAWY